MTAGHNKSGNGGGGESRGDGIATLVRVDLTVPFAVGLRWGEHTTLTAHVAESSLASTVSTTAANTRNTRDGTTSSPGFSRMLHAGLDADSVGLTVVLAHARMHE